MASQSGDSICSIYSTYWRGLTCSIKATTLVHRFLIRLCVLLCFGTASAATTTENFTTVPSGVTNCSYANVAGANPYVYGGFRYTAYSNAAGTTLATDARYAGDGGLCVNKTFPMVEWATNSLSPNFNQPAMLVDLPGSNLVKRLSIAREGGELFDFYGFALIADNSSFLAGNGYKAAPITVTIEGWLGGSTPKYTATQALTGLGDPAPSSFTPTPSTWTGISEIRISASGSDALQFAIGGLRYGLPLPFAVPCVTAIKGPSPSITQPSMSATPARPKALDLVLLRNTGTGQVKAWSNNGTGTGNVSTLLAPGDGAWTVAATGDLNGDGKTDILWRNASTGEVTAWLMDGAAMTGSAALLGPGNINWTVAGMGDLDGDGKADILWRDTTTGTVTAWLMNGLAVGGKTTLMGAGNVNWTVAGMGDLNRDGKADILWRDTATGTVTAWLMNGLSVGGQATLLAAGNTVTTVAGMGDLDGDGRADILWRDSVTGEVAAWLMNGTAATDTGILLGAGNTDWTVAAVGDLNGDGKADILWRDTVTGMITAWLMDGLAMSSTVTLSDVDNSAWDVVGQ